MDFDGNFKKRGMLTVGRLQATVRQLAELSWREDTSRAQQYEVHSQTECIPLLYDRDFRHSRPTQSKHYPRFELEIGELLRELNDVFVSGYCIRLILTRLLPRAKIPPHVDRGASFQYSHRLHCPLQTNPLVTFQVGSEIRTLQPGELWEINNSRTHSVDNQSDEHRVHLIADWVTFDLAVQYTQAMRSLTE